MRPGRLVVDFDGARESIEVTGGFVIVRPDRVDVLLDFEDLKPG
jgi:F0F1-type ATP synthase epsilon subunit